MNDIVNTLGKMVAEDHRATAQILDIIRGKIGKEDLEAWNALIDAASYLRIEADRRDPDSELSKLAKQHPIVQELNKEVERLQDVLDQERYKVAIGIQAIKKAIDGRKWLSEPGRGSYTYDDERYQQEFGQALDEINVALNPMRKIAGDWTDCPRDSIRVAKNRAETQKEFALVRDKET